MRPRCAFELYGSDLDLSVAATELQALYRQEGLKGLQARLARTKNVHIRLGLARAWAAYPDRCYLQINGIYGL